MVVEPESRSNQPGFGPHIPGRFTSLEEAQNSLNYHQNHCLNAAYLLDDVAIRNSPLRPFIDSVYLESYRQGRDLFQEILRQWSSAFEAFIARSSATVLKISHRISSLQVQAHGQDIFQKSRCWDYLRRECEEIVDLATSVVQLHEKSANDSSLRKPTFSLDMNIVSPLFSIAHRCRDPIIRRRIIALLYSAPRQEGLWNSILTARVAEKIMTIEEAGLGEVRSSADIPDKNRITEVDVQFDMQGRKGCLKCGRRMLTGQQAYVAGPTMEIFQEVVEW